MYMPLSTSLLEEIKEIYFSAKSNRQPLWNKEVTLIKIKKLKQFHM
jgi:hypothetical protein